MIKKVKNTVRMAMVLIVAAAVAEVCSAAEWGSLKGRFLVDGMAAKPAPLVVNKDQYCIDKKPPNDAVLVGKGNSLVNAIVYLRAPLGKKVDIHPDYEAKFKEPVVLDNNGCSFHPHIVMARVGQKLVVKNSDPVGHNTNLTLLSFNPIVPANDKIEVNVSTEGALPTPVACNIHAWMHALLLSLNHPYMAVSGEDGTFEIKNIPAGMHEFQFWHEAPGYLRNLKFKGGTTDSIHGRAKITIAAGQTLDLGDMKVPARVLVAK